MNNITALITPFNDDLKIDYKKLKELIIFQEKSNMDSLLLLGTTAEAFSLTLKEKLAICNIAFENYTKTKIIAIEGNNIDKILNDIDIFKNFMPNYFLITPPFFVKGDEKGILSFFNEIANYSPVPIIIYNIPSRAGFSISLNTLETLAKHHNIYGIKNASFDVHYNLKLSLLNSHTFEIYSGNDLSYLENISLNNNGCFSVIANIIPNYFSNIFELYQKDQFSSNEKFKKIINTLLDMERFVNPASIKSIMHTLNIIDYKLRVPFSSEFDSSKIINFERSIFNEYPTCR